MLTLIMTIMFFVVFGKLLGLSLRVGWSVFKIAAFLIFLPAIVLMMIFGGLLYIALPILIIAGIAGMVARA
ncbi:MAG: hypothetical protein K5857_07095 [Lachnospiraceae bacterium]|nr:hypothetical protein [Lachnospiraceae bacterium]